MLEHIRSAYPGMSRSHKKVAEFLLTYGIDVVYLSASRIAELVNVNRSTVVRTAQALGYEGFGDLQAALQQQLLQRFSTADRVRLDLLRLSEDLDDETGRGQGLSLLSALARAEIRDLEDIVSRIAESDFAQAVDWLERSRNIYVLGLRGSLPLALTFVFLLQHIRTGVLLLEPGTPAFAEHLVVMTPDDVLFTISYSRYARDTIRCMDYARTIGTPVITLTDSPVSPAAKRADLAFVLLFRMYLYRNTSTPQVLLNALAATLAARLPGGTETHLERLETVYEQFGIFCQDNE